jgi:hypothetical protein
LASPAKASAPGPAASAEASKKTVQVVEVRISEGDRLQGELRDERPAQLEDLSYRGEWLGVDTNAHPIMAEAPPDFEIELRSPPVAELHTVNIIDPNPVDVQYDVVRVEAAAATRRIWKYQPRHFGIGERATDKD